MTVAEASPAVRPPFPAEWTLADLREHLGGIPAERIRFQPLPGTATKKDVVEAEEKTGRLCELIDGVLVEKTMGSFESRLAYLIAHFLEDFLESHDFGVGYGADNMLEILPDQVRMPDVSFIQWERLPGRVVPRDAIPALTPDLAIEVLSKKNTKREMQRKLREYFAGGSRLVWYIDPRHRTARIYTAPDEYMEIDEQGVLSGGEVLPGFELPLRKLFARAERGRG